MLPTISVIVPVLNDAVGLRRCLASVRANQYPPDALEVIVADNGSVDSSIQVAIEADATMLAVPGLSVAAVRNRAAAAARGEILAFIDADHEVSSDWLWRVAEVFARADVAAAGAPYSAPPSATWVQRMYDALRTRPIGTVETRWLGSGNLAIRAPVFWAVGGFDTSLTACEDVDLCQRLGRQQFRLVADGALHSVHHGDPASLRRLFASELWRGRDNLRVSLRAPITARELPSVLFPVGLVMLFAALPIAAIVAIGGPVWPFAGLTLAILLQPMARAVVLVRRAGGGLKGFAQAYAVAATYEVARAFALVLRKPHRRAS
jgi:glycosyltransferase involved in cell wall biosynthesis